MNSMQNLTIVKKQYQTDEKLSIRINLHKNYSINKVGFSNWTFQNLPDMTGKTVLELGCGTGELWKSRTEVITTYDKLVLSDISDGMIESTKDSIINLPNIDFKTINAESIPYSENSFDYIIANHMLYHVPELDSALQEIYRVLKPSGKLISTTFGENGILKYINNLIYAEELSTPITSSFTIQSGRKVLSRYFRNIEYRDYEDGLRITKAQDLVDYIFSMSSLIDSCKYTEEELSKKIIEIQNSNDGVIEIKKEAGMFLSKK